MGFLELLDDPDRIAEAARKQAEAREKSSHVINRTPAQANYFFGLAKEKLAWDYLAARKDESDTSQFREQFAEGLALQARFKEASETTLDDERKAEYEAKAEAVERRGSRLCDCPLTTVRKVPGNAKGKTDHTHLRSEEFFDGERDITIFRCQQCGTFSAQ